MLLTALSVRPDTHTNRGMLSWIGDSLGFGLDLRRMWALAPPKPNELTATRFPLNGHGLSTT